VIKFKKVRSILLDAPGDFSGLVSIIKSLDRFEL
jgi:hypothetical protein